jgi:FtsH-binding integral membrane protein
MHDSMTPALDDLEAEAPPTSRTDEPRGPHVPDALAQIPYGTLIFGILALARLVWYVRETQLGPAPTLSIWIGYVGGLVPAVAAVLLPAVLLLRHPDAPTRARALLLGTILFAAAEGMRVLGPQLQPFFEEVTPGSEETPYLVPLTLLYTSIQGLLATYGVAEMGIGLGQARRFLEAAGKGLIVAVAVLVVLVAGGARVLAVAQLPFDQLPMTPTVAVYLASSIVLGILSVTAWAFLAATIARGARAGEDPETGWAVGALGTALIVAVFVVSSLLSLTRPSEALQGLFSAISQVLSIAFTLGYLGLLGAFLLGMPSLEELDDEDVDSGDLDDEDDLDADDDEDDIDADDVEDDAAARRTGDEAVAEAG